MDAWIVWLIVAVLLIIIELMTQMLWAFCLGIGSIGALVASLLGADSTWQVIVMAICAVIVYFTALPLFRKIQNRKSAHSARTGMDALLGRKAVVTQEIRPGEIGRARIDGDNWQVVAPDIPDAIKRGSEVTVTGYDSIILTVTPTHKL